MLPQKHFEIFDSQIARNALELSILLPPRLLYIILNLVRSHRADLSWLLGGGGGRGGQGFGAYVHSHCLRGVRA